MATINSRNESNKFVKLVGSTVVQKPADQIEDITIEILDVISDKTFNVYSDEACSILEGNFKVMFKQNDGVYLYLSNISGLKLYGDINFKDSIVLTSVGEQKLLDWVNLSASTIINIGLGIA